MSETTNYIYVSGEAATLPEYSHSMYGENFFSFFLSVRRLSGTEDMVPVLISERIIPQSIDTPGAHFSIIGQIRSYNKKTPGGSKLVISVFAKEIIRDADSDRDADCNECELTGFVCKPVIYRTTPFSREISDVLLAVNRNYGKSDYLPCIAWGRNARYLSNVSVGDKLGVSGRLQSRDYKKTLENGVVENRTAYEVSCSSVAVLSD
ncbi:MAG: single-stranded DNA-binding protein [Clostridium sp.]|nr:single-stranded DNA-binding protein [Clostridium sp.]